MGVSWYTQRAPYKNYYYDINYHHCEGQNERQKHLNYESEHRDDRQYVAKYSGGYTQHTRKEMKYLDGEGLQKRCAEDFVQAWKNLVGMTDKGEKRFEICQHDEERKFVKKMGMCRNPGPDRVTDHVTNGIPDSSVPQVQLCSLDVPRLVRMLQG